MVPDKMRRGVEGGRGANKEGNGVRRSQGGLAALQSTARAAGGREKLAAAAVCGSGEAGGRG